MMTIRLAAVALLLPTAACTGMAAEAGPGSPPTATECNAEGVQSLIGQSATPAIGARLLRETGARTLRWVPPRTAVTMDFRPDRLTVGYDDSYTITTISCG